MRFTFPAPVRDDDHDSCDDKTRPTARAATSLSHTAHADGARQAVPGQPRPPTTAYTLSRGCPASSSSSSSTSSAQPASRKQRDEAEAARADLLARLQRCSVTDADWDNATSSSSSSDDEPEDEDGKDFSSSHKGTTDHAARLAGLQGWPVEANRDAATNDTSTAHVASNSVATRRQQQQQPCPPGVGGRGHSPNQALGRWKSGRLQASRRCTGDCWVLLGRGEARPLGPGAPGLTVTRPDGAVFALRPRGSRDGGDDALVMRRKTS